MFELFATSEMDRKYIILYNLYMAPRDSQRVTINTLKDEVLDVLETGRANVTVVHEAQQMLREFRDIVATGRNTPEKVVIPGALADTFRVRLYSAVDPATEEVTED